jgi:hypothetical protein
MLKIRPSDLEVLRAACKLVTDLHPRAASQYQSAGHSHKRFRWDVLRATRLRIGDGAGAPGDIDLYAYLDDTHIDSALRAILGSEY